MLQFLQPIWLLGMAGITVPVLIHLWNHQQGKVLAVGSTSLLQQRPRKSARNLKVSEWLLLMLRCLLIIVLSLLLAGPVWRAGANASAKKGWVLLPGGNAKVVYQHFKLRIDSLVAAGNELHYFEPGFLKTSIAELGQGMENSPAKTNIAKQEQSPETGSPKTNTAEGSPERSDNNVPDYWAILAQLQQAVPADAPMYIFSDRLLKHFRGERSRNQLNLHWQTLPADTVTYNSLLLQYKTAADSVRVLTAFSNAGISYFKRDTRHTNADGHTQNSASSGDDVKTSDGSPAEMKRSDTATMQITIWAGTHAGDARYLQAALQAIRQFTGQQMNIRLVEEEKDLPQQQDWLFWLSETPVPAGAKALNTWQYKKGNPVQIHSWLQSTTGGGPEPGAVPVYKQVAATNDSNTVCWKNGYGQPLLTQQTRNTYTNYYAYTQLNPEWNGITWNAAFPVLIMQLINKDLSAQDYNTFDHRLIGELEMQPVTVAGITQSLQQQPVKELWQAGWLLLLLIFITERMLSATPAKQKEQSIG